MKKLLILITILSACSPKKPFISEQGKAAINETVDRSLQERKFPFALTMVTNAQGVIYEQSVGMTDSAQTKKATLNDIVAIYSMTKPVTTVAIFMLIEEGKLKLEDPVTQYLENYKHVNVIQNFNTTDTSYTLAPAKTITIKHLLSNTAGYGYTFGNRTLDLIAKKYKKDDLHIALELPLMHQPGAQWTYGPSAFILGQIIEKISGQSLDLFFADRVFKPLGMTDTFFKIPNDKLSRSTGSYARTSSSFVYLSRPNSDTKPSIYGDIGLYSTASDYIKFLRMLLNKGTFDDVKILSSKSVDLMTQNQIDGLFVTNQESTNSFLTEDFPPRPGKNKFGYGFEITTDIDLDPATRSSGSYNWSGIANTHFWVDPKKGIAVVYLTQLVPYHQGAFMQGMTEFEKAVYANLQ